MMKIVITGPESTGKSTLSNYLSYTFKCDLIDEYARKYIDELSSDYVQLDLLEIAKGQLNLEKKVSRMNQKLFICDTDLLTIKIWSEVKYGFCDDWIKDKLYENLPDVYLLCSPDLEWEYDPQRENQFNRNELFSIYKKEIERFNIPYKIIFGQGEERNKSALSFLSSYLK